jgi:xanthine dehydrogenase accessory factor
VYEIALTVEACVRAGTDVDVAWAVETSGFAQADRSEAVALTPGGGRVGGLLAGSLDGQLADVAAWTGSGGRLVDLTLADIEAAAAGLPSGGRARCLVVPARDLPDDLWPLLLDRRPVCLVTRLDGDEVVATTLHTDESIDDAGEEASELFGGGRSDTRVLDDAVVTVLHPVPRLVIAGGGPIADALTDAAALLGWHVQRATDTRTATGLVAGLAGLDQVVALGHDVELTGPVLAAALDGDVGYIGSIGPARVQQTRADWLAYRGVTDLTRVNGPAGLAIGASSPPEIAVAVLAEALAVRSASTVE